MQALSRLENELGIDFCERKWGKIHNGEVFDVW